MTTQEEYERLLKEQAADAETVEMPSRLISPTHVELSTGKGAPRQCPECGHIFQGKHPADHCPLGIIEDIMEESAKSRPIGR